MRLRHHWLTPISCHFRDCKVLLVASLTPVSSPITSVQTFTFTWQQWFDVDANFLLYPGLLSHTISPKMYWVNLLVLVMQISSKSI